MRWLTRGSRAPVGVDVGGRYINAVQLRGSSAHWRVEAAIRLPRSKVGAPLDGREVARLRRVLYRQAFVGDEIVLAVPSDRLMTAVLELPPRDSGAPIDQIVRMELARTYDAEPESFEIASWDLPTPQHARKATRTMTVGCSHFDADALYDVFHSAGLRVLALDTKAWATARAIKGVIQDQAGITAALDIEWKSAALALFHRDVVLYDRVLTETGLEPLYGDLTEALGGDTSLAEYVLDKVGTGSQTSHNGVGNSDLVHLQRRVAAHGDAIAREVATSLDYAAREYPDVPCEKLLLVGDGASIPGLTEHLAGALQVEVCAAPLSAVVCGCEALPDGCDDPALMPALGLAMFDG